MGVSCAVAKYQAITVASSDRGRRVHYFFFDPFDFFDRLAVDFFDFFDDLVADLADFFDRLLVDLVDFFDRLVVDFFDFFDDLVADLADFFDRLLADLVDFFDALVADFFFVAVFFLPPKTLSQFAQNSGVVPVRTIGPPICRSPL